MNMHCNQGETLRDQQQCDPTGPLSNYMKSRGVFKASKTNTYHLCRFYRMVNFPPFPAPRDPATTSMIRDLLGAAQATNRSYLLMIFAGEAAAAICLLRALHNKDSMKWITLETKSCKQAAEAKPRKPGANSKSVRKLSSCPLCLYCGSNDLSYLNHIVVVHYNVAYGCGLCPLAGRVLPTSQMLKNHLKHCEGFLKDEVATSSSDYELQTSTSKGSPRRPSTRAHNVQASTSSQSGS